MLEFRFNGQTYRALFPDLLRPLTPDERTDLEGSIKDRGVNVPCLVDENNGIIDGLNRFAVSESLGREEIPVRIVPGLSDDEKRSLAVEVNDCRRQQSVHELIGRRRTRAEKREAIAAALIEQPELSDRAIAEKVEEKTGEKPDHKTVGDVRSHLGKSAQIPQVPASTGRDGKTYKRTDSTAPEQRKESPARPPAPRPEPKPRKPAFDWAGLTDRVRPAHAKLSALAGSASLLMTAGGNADFIPARLAGLRSELLKVIEQLQETIEWSQQQAASPA